MRPIGEALEGMNHTELYQMCRRAGIHVHPRASRQELMYLLRGGEIPELIVGLGDHPIDAWRVALIGFLSDYWARVEPQLKCPAKNLKNATHPDPWPCFGCVDGQVITCVVTNPKSEQLIQLHLPKRNT